MKRRDWTLAVAKVHGGEQRCRVCGTSPVETAHVIGRARDLRSGNVIRVNPDAVIPLCREHHRAYDAYELDVLPVLTVSEQAQAVEDAGGIISALRRISGRNAA
jgi:hypothetical protein